MRIGMSPRTRPGRGHVRGPGLRHRATLLALVAAVGLMSACTGTPRSTDATGGTAASSATDPTTSGSATGTPTPADPAAAVVAENARAGDDTWQLTEATTADTAALAAYASAAGARVGEDVELKVRSTLGPFTVTAVRTGDYRGHGGRVVWTSPPVEPTPQPEPRVLDGGMVVAGWATSLTLHTEGWPDGSYLLVVRAGGLGQYVPLTLSPRDVSGRVVLVNPTTTWQAYNDFGGYSLYKGPTARTRHAVRVSFDRPYADNAQHFRLDEWPYVRLAERVGLPMAYLTSQDLERPGALDGAVAVVSGGHDEYWSVPMRAAVTAARDAGTNLAFLGGNELYWRVRLEDAGRTVVGYRTYFSEDPVTGPTTTALWRSGPSPDPENSLTGQLYECYPVSGPWTVTTPEWFGYAGTGVTAGASFAGVVGVESNRAYPVEGTPPTLQVVARAPVQCGPKGSSVHTATYYTVPSGAGVVAVGTINWANVVGGTAGDAAAQSFATKVTENVLTEMAKGPVGRRHPALANLAAQGLSPSTAQGTGGPVGTR